MPIKRATFVVEKINQIENGPRNLSVATYWKHPVVVLFSNAILSCGILSRGVHFIEVIGLHARQQAHWQKLGLAVRRESTRNNVGAVMSRHSTLKHFDRCVIDVIWCRCLATSFHEPRLQWLSVCFNFVPACTWPWLTTSTSSMSKTVNNVSVIYAQPDTHEVDYNQRLRSNTFTCVSFGFRQVGK